MDQFDRYECGVGTVHPVPDRFDGCNGEGSNGFGRVTVARLGSQRWAPPPGWASGGQADQRSRWWADAKNHARAGSEKCSNGPSSERVSTPNPSIDPIIVGRAVSSHAPTAGSRPKSAGDRKGQTQWSSFSGTVITRPDRKAKLRTSHWQSAKTVEATRCLASVRRWPDFASRWPATSSLIRRQVVRPSRLAGAWLQVGGVGRVNLRAVEPCRVMEVCARCARMRINEKGCQ